MSRLDLAIQVSRLVSDFHLATEGIASNLAYGHIGSALLCSVASRVDSSFEWRKRSVEHLRAVSRRYYDLGYGLFQGRAGALLVANHIAHHDQQILRAFRASLLKDTIRELHYRVRFEVPESVLTYDLMFGHCGVLLALASSDLNETHPAVESILSYFNWLVDDQERWRTVTPRYGSSGSLGNNLSVSHGLSGIIIACCSFPKSDVAACIVSKAIRFLLTCSRGSLVQNSFKWRSHVDGTDREEKIGGGWCYGGYGIAAVLATALSVFKDLDDRALALGLVAHLTYEADKFVFQHSGICHGLAGQEICKTVLSIHGVSKNPPRATIDWSPAWVNSAEAELENILVTGVLPQDLSFLEGLTGLLVMLLSGHGGSLSWMTVLGFPDQIFCAEL